MPSLQRTQRGDWSRAGHDLSSPVSRTHSIGFLSTGWKTSSSRVWCPDNPEAMSTIVLSSPAALVASLPYLVGFEPDESVVLVWLREGDIVLTQRADLPARDTPEWLAALWQHPASETSDALIIAALSRTSDVSRIVRAVIDQAHHRGPRVLDAIVVGEHGWSSLMCDEATCACSTGQHVPVEIRTAVAAEFAFRGIAPVASRSVLEDEIDYCVDPAVVRRLGARGIVRPMTSRAVEKWRDRAIRDATGWMTQSTRPNVISLARVISGVQDVRVRDVVLWELAHADVEAVCRAIPRWQTAIRVSPEAVVASVAVIAAVGSWLMGDGARAAVSLKRGLDADPGNSLAHLVNMALAGGLPPCAWREATLQLSREECRHGNQVVARHRSVVL